MTLKESTQQPQQMKIEGKENASIVRTSVERARAEDDVAPIALEELQEPNTVPSVHQPDAMAKEETAALDIPIDHYETKRILRSRLPVVTPTPGLLLLDTSTSIDRVLASLHDSSKNRDVALNGVSSSSSSSTTNKRTSSSTKSATKDDSTNRLHVLAKLDLSSSPTKSVTLKVVTSTKQSFVENLDMMLCEGSATNSKAVHWAVDGQSFVIDRTHRQDLAGLMQPYFNHACLSVLTRQFQHYEFQKEPIGKMRINGKHRYHNPKFHRDTNDSEQLTQVRPVRRAATKTPMKTPKKAPMKSPKKTPMKNARKTPKKIQTKTPRKTPKKSPKPMRPEKPAPLAFLPTPKKRPAVRRVSNFDEQDNMMPPRSTRKARIRGFDELDNMMPPRSTRKAHSRGSLNSLSVRFEEAPRPAKKAKTAARTPAKKARAPAKKARTPAKKARTPAKKARAPAKTPGTLRGKPLPPAGMAPADSNAILTIRSPPLLPDRAESKPDKESLGPVFSFSSPTGAHGKPADDIQNAALSVCNITSLDSLTVDLFGITANGTLSAANAPSSPSIASPTMGFPSLDPYPLQPRRVSNVGSTEAAPSVAADALPEPPRGITRRSSAEDFAAFFDTEPQCGESQTISKFLSKELEIIAEKAQDAATPKRGIVEMSLSDGLELSYSPINLFQKPGRPSKDATSFESTESPLFPRYGNAPTSPVETTTVCDRRATFSHLHQSYHQPTFNGSMSQFVTQSQWCPQSQVELRQPVSRVPANWVYYPNPPLPVFSDRQPASN
ncbi:expressed unknown protein [Seminavis robusta]|uniref:HSF-type DNA-binding domain-containing protein n=1 Tax=Seminavis robusta TaxID=568900 RepID=A0A9N8DCK9_9STRA|nr:expressed unknown protein [Seminavis robusta]|eukprot:Sro61_g034990.1 n/a (779) ;mRNA; f:59162-61648